MPTRGRALCTAALAGLMLAGCDRNCLHSDCSVIDSIAANVRLCGFPLEQIDRIGEGSIGVLRVGQRISLRLKGDLDRVVSVDWSVKPSEHAPNPPRLTFERRSDNGAVLVALAPGGTDPVDYVWATAHIVFRDGTETGAPPAYCRDDSDWIPANRIFVR